MDGDFVRPMKVLGDGDAYPNKIAVKFRVTCGTPEKAEEFAEINNVPSCGKYFTTYNPPGGNIVSVGKDGRPCYLMKVERD